MNEISIAGNTVVPALLVLEKLGFIVSLETIGGADHVQATRGDEIYTADDPVALLGLVKLIEERGWEWHPSDSEIHAVIERYQLG